MESNELYHHGILGQKWGVRRYQNADGSLTPRGKKKYGTATNFNKVQAAKKRAAKKKSVDKAREKANARTQAEIDKYNKKAGIKDKKKGSSESDGKPKVKPLSEMTDEEVRARINRIKMENELKALTPEHISRGKRMVNACMEVAVPALKSAAKDQLTKYLNNKLSDIMGNDHVSKYEAAKRDAEYTENLKKIAQNKKAIKDVDKPDKNDKYADAKREAEYRKNLKSAYADERDLRNMRTKDAAKDKDSKNNNEASKNKDSNNQQQKPKQEKQNTSKNSEPKAETNSTKNKTKDIKVAKQFVEEQKQAIDINKWDVKEHTPKQALRGYEYLAQLTQNEADFLDGMWRYRK